VETFVLKLGKLERIKLTLCPKRNNLSNLSNIGFGIKSEEAFYEMANRAYQMGYPIDTELGSYVRYTDPSGAELWLQLNKANEFVGLNPHYLGKSRREISITQDIARPDGLLDGAFHAWANPSDKDNPESGFYPFVFDLPDFETIGPLNFPYLTEMQLAAFALEIRMFDSEADHKNVARNDLVMSTQSFIPSGLFPPNQNNISEMPLALCVLTGVIKEFILNTNQLTKKEFYWLLVQTLGGEIDVLIAPSLIKSTPVVGGIIQGQFWLSGRLINPPTKFKRKGILPKRIS